MVWEESRTATAVFTVDRKERRCASSFGDGDDTLQCRYTVYGTRGEVFSNNDAILVGEPPKMDSMVLQERLRVGRTYRVELMGWRVPLLSWHMNIINARDISAP